MRDGLWRFDPRSGERTRLAGAALRPAPRNASTTARPTRRAASGSARSTSRARAPKAGAVPLGRAADSTAWPATSTVSNGLAWSPDGRTMYWTDTTAHRVRAFDFDPPDGTPVDARVFARFPPRAEARPWRPTAAGPTARRSTARAPTGWRCSKASACCAWRPTARVLQRTLALPVRCPTMPCFGGADLRTLYVTTARENRPAEELAAQPLAGCVLTPARATCRACRCNFARAVNSKRGAAAGPRARSGRGWTRAPAWDLVVVGGGATGSGWRWTPRRAVSRWCCSRPTTSPRAPRRAPPSWLHGGVRYLAQGDIGLVREALHERARDAGQRAPSGAAGCPS